MTHAAWTPRELLLRRVFTDAVRASRRPAPPAHRPRTHGRPRRQPGRRGRNDRRGRPGAETSRPSRRT
ncbi:hypothetical protein LV779_02420 [Streptomyces thinghirensis]|nr:hypothetical protein [Streptomyces thinghirensis]